VWEGRFAQAARRFERGAESARAPWRRAEGARFFLLLARVRSLAGRHAEAVAALQAAQRVAGNQPVLEYLRGLSALSAGQPEEAARAVYRLGHEMRRERAGWTEPWRLLLEGELALARGDAATAAPLVAEAWRLASARPQDCVGVTIEAYFLDAVGRVALASGRPQEALEAFDRIGALGARALHQPEIVVLSLHRSGRALEDLGRGAEAAERYRRFLARWGEADGPPEETRDAAVRLARPAP
jgi:tetratricopeptide (TPR) repeat protein